MRYVMITFSILSVLLLMGCVEPPVPHGPGNPSRLDDTGATLEDVNAVVDANNRFAIDLYKRYSMNNENVFFSPYSISSAMAMVYEGANGQTADEIKTVFYYPDNSTSMRLGYAKIYNTLNKPSNNYELSTANALWIQKNYHIEQNYLNVINKYYGGKVTNLDFKSDTEGSRKTINSWVEEQTNDKIKNLLPTGSITPATRLVLTNAIYFKGKWVKQFDPKDTQKKDFFVSPSKTVDVDMMSLTGEQFNYTEDNDVQVLELPYDSDMNNNKLSMLIILPKNKSGLSSVEQSLTLNKINQWRSGLSKTKVDVSFPKFKMETEYTLNNDLADMGMPTAFIPGAADFSGMTGNKDLFISKVVHKAFVEVNEEGTEAAAATGVGMLMTVAVPEVKIFNANHPFIFIIQDDNGEILFMGRVSNPA
ncbi:serpin family protein [Candidatus Micrarchaeota archaeon]|nr:serpin family protein [Candidatus Micrarchaeota archaeon]